MNVSRAEVAFRDRTILDVFDLALRFLAVKVRAYAKVSAVILVPCLAMSVVTEELLGWGAAWVVSVGLALMAQAPFTVLASRLVFEREVATGAVVGSALRDLPRLFVMRCITGLALVFSLGFLVPSTWFATEVMILERATVFDALGRSRRVTQCAFGDVVSGVFLALLVVVGGVLIGDVGGRALIGDLELPSPAPLWTSGGSVLGFAGLYLVMPFLATARFFTYLNVRTRAEGWDIQTRFAALAQKMGEA